MLKHRLATAIFAIAIGEILFFCDLGSPMFYFGLGLSTFVYLLVEFCGAYFIGLNFHLKSLNYLDKNKNKIALTFDDGPIKTQTLKVLETLKKHNVKATFFVIGKNIKGNETILQQILSDGHSIGSHSFSHHFWIDTWGKNKLEDDILQSLNAIKAATGRDVKIIRPPYGVTTPNFRSVFRKLDLQSVGWNVRSYDTSSLEMNGVLNKILNKTKNGSIILLHDKMDFIPELLDKLIPALKQKNFEFVSIN